MEKTMEILKRVRPDVDFTAETELIDQGILSSFDIMELIGELSDAYDIDIEAEDVVPANFNSAEGICKLIQRVLAEEKNT